MRRLSSADLTKLPSTEQAYAFESYFKGETLALQQTDKLQEVALHGENTGGAVAAARPAQIIAPIHAYYAALTDPTVLLKPFDYSYISTDFNIYSHPGLDLVAPFGTPITAEASGCILSTTGGWDGGYGNLTIEDIGNGYTIRYAHQLGFAQGIRPGACVDAGQLIGYVGLTGHTTGPHLHMELRRYGIPVRPNFH